FLKIYIQEEEEMEEIEMSSRFIETADTLVVNSNFLLPNYESETVSFILKNDILVTVHSEELSSFHETTKKLSANPRNYPTGFHVMTALMEARVEIDADMIEEIIDKITVLSDTLRDADEGVLMDITELQEQIMKIRQNIIEKQSELHPKLTIILRDITSLIDHAKFSFERLNNMQEIFMGLVNVQQNKIIKIFTIVSVIFMPPTLVASIFGQNIPGMPFTGTSFGFWASIIIMFIITGMILLVFKLKKWL
ncbi:MAG: magnesium and cobalt transport protein CorA, partial [Bacteroidia bacterium]|nr:magnesium and cobalt transport protein CorA [Bacteroidia bacterium]